MNKAPLRQIFTPIQPLSDPKNITYEQYAPHSHLQDFIYCYWQLKTNQQFPDGFNHQIVTDGCMDIFFDINRPSHRFVMGFASESARFNLPQNFHFIGVRFLPTALPLLFRIDAHELTNKDEWLDDVFPGTARFIRDNFHPEMSIKVIIHQLDQYFGKLYNQLAKSIDSRLAHALYLIAQNQGIIPIEKGIDVGLSNRQLRRLFRQYVGHSPKTFAKVVRFQHLLKLNDSAHLYNSKLFYDLGYHDQAHFIKEFKKLFGTTPTQAFGKLS
ncbi:hypothetical protein BKI52_05380 [marine bacterium AO1-C]|nr:hypothetical protein BKI52_05380 [marine bacterium AO1-C]